MLGTEALPTELPGATEWVFLCLHANREWHEEALNPRALLLGTESLPIELPGATKWVFLCLHANNEWL